MTEDDRPGLGVNCIDLVEMVTDYLEGGLDAATRAEIEAHLALCPGCETYLEQMRQTIEAVGHVPVESLPDDAIAELMAAFRDFPAPTG